MFVKSETDTRRVQIIDVSHLFYKYAFGNAASLSSTLNIDGVLTKVDTTLPTYVIKTIHRWSHGGIYPTVVCFDSKGSNKARKGYCIKHNFLQADGGYKSGRTMQDGTFYEGINITMNLLLKGGVCCLKAEGYEADDLIKASVDKAKEQYPDLPIDVITGDRDLVPLVDDQVSVFLTSKKTSTAVDDRFKKTGYVQITPANYQSYMEELSDYKKLSVPYNSVLLTKLLRGDKSDKIPAYPKFTPTKYNALIQNLVDDGADLSMLFRYDSPTKTYCYRGTGLAIPEHLIESTPREDMMVHYGEPPTLTLIREVLSNYLEPGVVEHIRVVYHAINLNGAFTDLTPELNRRPAKITADIKGYDAGLLQSSVSCVQIVLPIM